MSAASDVAVAVQSVADYLGAATADPGDGIRLLLALAAAQPGGISGAGRAMAARCRRAALIAACRQSAIYQPTSYDDAQAMLASIAAALDAEITVAGDAGDDASYVTLRALRTAVIADLTARGADLAPLIVVSRPLSVPALALANQLYGDATREDDLVRRIDPVHPLFTGGTFRVLAR